MEFKIGIGYDIHRLVKGRKLMLGGLEIPHTKGLLGHSDADVLLHAVCDSVLGAVGCGDIGEHFPDTDAKFKGIASTELLKKVCSLAVKKGFRINNIDTVIILENPKLSAYKTKIRENICNILKLKEDSVSIKAKTNEGLGPVGKGEAIACYAAVIVSRGVKK